jgi:Yip1 domain
VRRRPPRSAARCARPARQVRRTGLHRPATKKRNNAMALIDRVKNILLAPKAEWPVIAGEPATVQSLYVGYIMILAAIGPVALALQVGLFGMGLGIAVIAYAVGLAIVYLMAWIIDALAPTFGGEKDFVKSLQLIAFSYTAAWVAGIFHLMPMVGSLLALAAGAYSVYTFYLGAPVMRKCAPEKAVVFTIVVVLGGIVVGAVLFNLLLAVIGGGSMMGMMGMGR